MTMNELAEKYYMPTLEEFIRHSEESQEIAKIIWYRMLLENTDHIPNKMIEAFFEVLSKLTATNFLSEMLTFIKRTYREYQPILLLRAECRKNINLLEQE